MPGKARDAKRCTNNRVTDFDDCFSAAQTGITGLGVARKKKEVNMIQNTSGKKPFDINIYFKAVGMYYSDLFNKKLPYFFKNIGPVFKGFSAWWNKQPQDMQLSYGALFLGNLMIVVGVVLIIII